MKRKMPPKTLLWVLLIAVLLGILALAALLLLNARVKREGGAYLLSPEEAKDLEGVDCILVLGCGVRDDGTPSDMLRDRVRTGVSLWQDGVSPKLLMSGDHGRTDYNEVGVMKALAVEAGVPDTDVFMDHAGFSTYESMVRARDVFCAKKIVIVSQEYHLYRAVYVARALGLDAFGVSADLRPYAGQSYREAREVLARAKDFLTSVLQPKPTYLGDPIPISGDGNLTND